MVLEETHFVIAKAVNATAVVAYEHLDEAAIAPCKTSSRTLT